MTEVASRLEDVLERIEAAASRAGRNHKEVALIAVSKGVPPAIITDAMEAGQRIFGENRVGELAEKAMALRSADAKIRPVWHFVGRLQRNKVKALSGLTQTIHSVDRLSLAREIDRRFEGSVEILVEVNTSGEASKAGVDPGGLADFVGELIDLPRLRVAGLMTMAPLNAPAEQARPYFRTLADLREDLENQFPQAMIHQLSMGMSQDYEVAIQEGATMVRIGRAIFGER